MTKAPSTTELVQAYLSLRRSFGFQLDITGYVFRPFARFGGREAAGKSFSVELALRWTQSVRPRFVADNFRTKQLRSCAVSKLYQ
jgi:hypothetical protein